MGRSESNFWISSDMMRQLPPEPSRQEAFEDLVINFILDQEENFKQLEEYMGVIGSDFMQLCSEENTPPVTRPEEVEETLGTPIEVEAFNETQLEDLGLNACNHDIPLSSKEVPAFTVNGKCVSLRLLSENRLRGKRTGMPNVERHASGYVFRLRPVLGYDSLVSEPGYREPVISISLDSSEDSVGTPAGRVILFGTIPTTIPDTTPVITIRTTQTDTTVLPTEIPIIAPTIPPSLDYTLVSLDYSPASDSEYDPSKDPSSDHIPPLSATSPFLSSDDDTTDSDKPDTPPSPTHAPGQPIPYGRPYLYHLNGPVHMMTARKRVGLLPTHRLAVRHSVDHCSSNSSSEASSNFHSDASSDSSSRHSLPDHSSPDLPSTFAGPSRKRRRSPMTSAPALPPVSGALSHIRADLIPSPKRIRSLETATDLEGCSKDSFEPYVPKEVGLGVDIEDESSEPSSVTPPKWVAAEMIFWECYFIIPLHQL
ncbi:hypothetical protein Tco_0851126 [Tanacetum coccineum]